MVRKLIGAIFLLASACGSEVGPIQKVQTSGKSEVEIAQVPADVIAAAEAARAGFTPREAERETREGRQYYDIEGQLADCSEIEFDIMEDSSGWKVVEVQRDIEYAVAPDQVRQIVAAADPAFKPGRVIESTQEDGVVIYELFGPSGPDPLGRKVEIKWDGRKAEMLTKEWAH